MMYVEQGECCVIGSGSWTITHSCLYHIWTGVRIAVHVYVCGGMFVCVSVCVLVRSQISPNDCSYQDSPFRTYWFPWSQYTCQKSEELQPQLTHNASYPP